MIKLISASSLNNVIGRNNRLPWHYSEDLKRFKELTINSTVVMGATTFLHDLKAKPLKDRSNIILSTKLVNTDYPEVKICRSIEEVLAITDRDFWVIGGKTVYEVFLPLADLLEITYIHKAFIGDCFFNIDYSMWELSSQQHQEELTFATYIRKTQNLGISSLLARLYPESEANIAEISRQLGELEITSAQGVYSFPSEKEYEIWDKEIGE